MRISIIQGDPDFVADGKRYIVKLDGVVQRDCIIVDTDKQLIVRYKRNKVGLLCKGRTKKFETETLYGEVSIERMSDEQYAIHTEVRSR